MPPTGWIDGVGAGVGGFTPPVVGGIVRTVPGAPETGGFIAGGFNAPTAERSCEAGGAATGGLMPPTPACGGLVGGVRDDMKSLRRPVVLRTPLGFAFGFLMLLLE